METPARRGPLGPIGGTPSSAGGLAPLSGTDKPALAPLRGRGGFTPAAPGDAGPLGSTPKRVRKSDKARKKKKKKKQKHRSRSRTPEAQREHAMERAMAMSKQRDGPPDLLDVVDKRVRREVDAAEPRSARRRTRSPSPQPAAAAAPAPAPVERGEGEGERKRQSATARARRRADSSESPPPRRRRVPLDSSDEEAEQRRKPRVRRARSPRVEDSDDEAKATIPRRRADSSESPRGRGRGRVARGSAAAPPLDSEEDEDVADDRRPLRREPAAGAGPGEGEAGNGDGGEYMRSREAGALVPGVVSAEPVDPATLPHSPAPLACCECSSLCTYLGLTAAGLANFVAGLCGRGIRPSPPPLTSMADPQRGIKALQGRRRPCVMSVTVRGCDRGTRDPYVLHPVTRVHFVDAKTGRYLGKAHRGQPVTSLYEASTLFSHTHEHGSMTGRTVRRPSACSYVLPQMTAPCRGVAAGGRAGSSSALPDGDTPPVWDEELLFDESYHHFLRPEVLMLVEVLDYGPNLPKAALLAGDGFYRVAWGFLKLIAGNGDVNANVPADAEGAVDGDSPVSKSYRLQLFKYQDITWWEERRMTADRAPAGARQCSTACCGCCWPPPPEDSSSRVTAAIPAPPVFLQYRKRKRVKAPFTVTVVVKGVDKPRRRAIMGRPLKVNEVESHTLTMADVDNEDLLNESDFSDDDSASGSATSIASEDELGPGQKGKKKKKGKKRRGGAGAGEDEEADGAGHEELVTHALRRRHRETHDACKPPNMLAGRLPAGSLGCSALAFSPNGHFLAAACVEAASNPVRVYNADTGALLCRLKGHFGIVYDLSWSMDGGTLLSASGDGTLRSWHIPSDTSKRAPSGSIMHYRPPCYIYAGQFVPGQRHVFVSGGYDAKVRLWELASRRSRRRSSVVRDDGEHEAMPAGGTELGVLGGDMTHTTHVNTIVFHDKAGRMVTGDAHGVIIVWSVGTNVRSTLAFQPFCTIRHPSLSGKSVAALSLRPRSDYLLVSATQNYCRLLNIKRLDERHPTTFTDNKRVPIVNTYGGAAINTPMLQSCFSPDGRFVLAGSETGEACIWSTDAGTRVTTPGLLVGFDQMCVAAAWHPTQHVVAVGSFAADRPILLYANEDQGARL